ncbi:MAG: fibronectin type III domain-containing protein [Ilumatobacteraceae bacterium]
MSTAPRIRIAKLFVAATCLLATLTVTHSQAVAAPSPALAADASISGKVPSSAAGAAIDNPARPTLFFVFQPFCQYCKKVAPIIAKLHKDLGADMDFVMVTSYTNYSSYSADFRTQHGLTMPLIEDASLDFAKYKITGYPEFLWSVPGKPVVNWGPVGYDEKAWAWRDLPAALRREKYGEPPTSPGNLAVKKRPEVGVVDVSWSAATTTTKAPIKHYEVRVFLESVEWLRVPPVAVFGVEALSATIRVPDAQINQGYVIGVRAVSDAGEGANSTFFVTRWTSPTPKPTSVTCQRRAVTRVFSAAACPRGWTKVG